MKICSRYQYLTCLFIYSIFSFAQSNQGNVIDEVVWVVGDEAILRSDVEKRRLEFGNSITGNPYCVIPEQLAIQKLFLHQAAIDSIEVADADINQFVEQEINEQILYAGSKEKLEEYRKMTISQLREEYYDQYKNTLTMRNMRSKLTEEVKVTPAEVRRYFKDLPEDSLPLIPTQVYSSLLNLLHFFLLLWISRHKTKDGQVAASYLIFYGIGRFLMEFLRGDLERGTIGSLSTSQFISIFITVGGVLLFMILTGFTSKKALKKAHDNQDQTL